MTPCPGNMEDIIENIDVDDDIRSGIVSEEELEKETGAGPRGDRSRYIETDTGTVQSKYRFIIFQHLNILNILHIFLSNFLFHK